MENLYDSILHEEDNYSSATAYSLDVLYGMANAFLMQNWDYMAQKQRQKFQETLEDSHDYLVRQIFE